MDAIYATSDTGIQSKTSETIGLLWERLSSYIYMKTMYDKNNKAVTNKQQNETQKQRKAAWREVNARVVTINYTHESG